jgi:endonuclease/exonuclease/phosphatase family metal-dependent hydrolase
MRSALRLLLASMNKVDMSLAVGDVAVANPTRRIDYIFTNKQSKHSPFKVTNSLLSIGWTVLRMTAVGA